MLEEVPVGGCLGLLPVEEYVYIYMHTHFYNNIITYYND